MSARFGYYGISPFEIEAIFSTLSGSFNVIDEQLSDYEDSYVTFVNIEFPTTFTENFFEIFTMERWFKIKGIIKEIKRRRGRKGARVILRFCGLKSDLNFTLTFSLHNKKERHFEMALEKIEYLVDIIPIQLQNLPATTREVVYNFDDSTFRWSPAIAIINNELLRYQNDRWIK